LKNIAKLINFSVNMRKLDQVPQFWLTLRISEAIFSRFRPLIDYDEPIPPFETRFPGRLEGILGSVSQRFRGQYLNLSVLEASAAYFNQIVRGHPFINGNKRIAVLFTHVFLFWHGIDFILSPKGMYNFAVLLANSSEARGARETKEICKLVINKFTKEISQA
jgi:death-on-curing protein